MMNKTKSYEITISPNYVSNWGINEAIREILQNAIDAETNGYEKEVNYNEEARILEIVTKNITLSAKDLILGCSSKEDQDNMIGKYGEGFKLALVVLLRKGMSVCIHNGNKEWNPSFKLSDNFQTQVLNIDEEIFENNDNQDLSFEIMPVDKQLYDTILNNFPCIRNDWGKTIETNTGTILFDKRFKGKMFVEGLYIQTDNNFQYGYNFNSDVVQLDRDRKAINYYELRALTAESIITAQECNAEIFDAISDSCVDVRDIKEVLDEASDSFLEEYRDQFYEKNQLDDNTLVATESVKKQLEQMDIDVPVVEGSEITSYLIAKANDKLGLINEAQEIIKTRSNDEEAFDDFINSSYFKFMKWYLENEKYLPEESQDEFLRIVENIKSYQFYRIAKYIDDNFNYDEESINRLEKAIKDGLDENTEM